VSLDVTGKWTGTWSAFDPGAGDAPQGERLRMEADVRRDGAAWTATFEANCGGEYSYSVTMAGRTAGDVVLFTGSADLGSENGGVFDWIGRASDRAFIGFYTSAGYTGMFALSRTNLRQALAPLAATVGKHA
jgi:hypothetical protein